MNLLVIHEYDHDKENSVIGVADSVENAEKVIDEYYGEYEELSFRDIRDSSLECSKVLRLRYSPKGCYYNVTVILEWFKLNKP